ncbi:hypothetical protein ACFPPA_11560 [Rhodanobacter ginsengisoli]|uniref:Uncharacterized protein n=1 Tax=Rhodanobacter ginsengisoli TaxID=418646 RepID=A0ABW0QQ41_9GAMM
MDGIFSIPAAGLALPAGWFMSGIDPERMPGMPVRELTGVIGAADGFLPTLSCL